MKCTNTQIRVLVTLLALASIAVVPAAAAGSSESSDKTNQTTEQSNSTRPLTLNQKFDQLVSRGKHYNGRADILGVYTASIDRWPSMYGGVAMPAIKKYGTDKEKTNADIIAKNAKKLVSEIGAVGAKIDEYADISYSAKQRMGQHPNDDNYDDFKEKVETWMAAFDAGTQIIFKDGQIIQQYHQLTTAVLARIITELEKDPKTKGEAAKIAKKWKDDPFTSTAFYQPSAANNNPATSTASQATNQTPAGK